MLVRDPCFSISKACSNRMCRYWRPNKAIIPSSARWIFEVVFDGRSLLSLSSASCYELLATMNCRGGEQWCIFECTYRYKALLTTIGTENQSSTHWGCCDIRSQIDFLSSSVTARIICVTNNELLTFLRTVSVVHQSDRHTILDNPFNFRWAIALWGARQ